MTTKAMASRIQHIGRGIAQQTPYGKRTERLANRIFGEVVTPTDGKSFKASHSFCCEKHGIQVVRVMSKEPFETTEQLSPGYYPNLPMFHYLTKLLRFHGLFFDDHVMWRQVQDELKTLRGKVVRPPIGQGKRAQLRSAKK